jgi:AbrB family looped-hinge helix DNA binding protein
MASAKVTSKGQVTIPKSVRDDLGLRTGDVIEFVPTDGFYALKKKVTTSPFDKYRGVAKRRMAEMGFRTTDEFIEAARGR